MPGGRVEVIGDPRRWAACRDSWGAVLGDAPARTVFSTWEWLSAWTDTFAGASKALAVLAVRLGDEVIGYAPWYVDRIALGPVAVKRLAPIGFPESGSDYLDVIARRGCEREVATSLVEFLFGKGRGLWDVASLADMPAESAVLACMLDELDRRGKFYQVRPGAYCPVAELPDDPGALRESLSANRRQQWARHQRLLERRGPVTLVASRPAAGSSDWDRFFALYAIARRDRRADARLRVMLEAYAKAMPGRPAVRMEFLTVGGRDVAAALFLEDDRVLRLYLLAVDRGFRPDLSVGNVLIGLSLDRAVRDGLRAYDFLKGSEPYKFHWARGGRRTLRIEIFQRRPLGMLAGVVDLARGAAKLLLR